MEMAEKVGTEGRCPKCYTLYDKKKKKKRLRLWEKTERLLQ